MEDMEVQARDDERASGADALIRVGHVRRVSAQHLADRSSPPSPSRKPGYVSLRKFATGGCGGYHCA